MKSNPLVDNKKLIFDMDMLKVQIEIDAFPQAKPLPEFNSAEWEPYWRQSEEREAEIKDLLHQASLIIGEQTGEEEYDAHIDSELAELWEKFVEFAKTDWSAEIERQCNGE